MARKQKKWKVRRSSKLAIALLAILFCIMGIMLHNMQIQLDHARSEYEVYASRLNILQEENYRLQQDIENSGNPEFIEEIARNNLGLVSYGEKIFRFQY